MDLRRPISNESCGTPIRSTLLSFFRKLKMLLAVGDLRRIPTTTCGPTPPFLAPIQRLRAAARRIGCFRLGRVPSTPGVVLMKDTFYVLFALIGLVLVGVGVAQIREHRRSQARPDSFEQIIGQHFPSGAFSHPMTQPMGTAGSTVPAESVFYLLFGYLFQVVGCGLYADRRGRSPFFGLLGLLSPIGYVLLSLLSPSSRIATSNAASPA